MFICGEKPEADRGKKSPDGEASGVERFGGVDNALAGSFKTN